MSPSGTKPVAKIRNRRVDASQFDDIGARYEDPLRPSTLPAAPPAEPTPTLTVVTEAPKTGGPPAAAVPAPAPASSDEPESGTVVWRKGRILRDGTRRGMKQLKRATLYFEPETHKGLLTVAAEMNLSASDLNERIVATFLEDRARSK